MLAARRHQSESRGRTRCRTRRPSPLTPTHRFFPLSTFPTTQVKQRQFRWYPGQTASTGHLFVSPSACADASSTPGAGNEGVRGLTFSQCMDLCLTIPKCRVVSFWPSWFGGVSACFSQDESQVANLHGTPSAVPVASKDTAGTVYGAYFGHLY